jgi:hypothetical protein
MFQVEQAITSPFEDFDLIIEAFHKTTIGTVKKEIGNFLPPIHQCLQKIIKTSQTALFNSFLPGLDFYFCDRLRDVFVKDGR